MKQVENVGRKIPEFKLPDIYPASFNPANICAKQKKHLWQIFPQNHNGEKPYKC